MAAFRGMHVSPAKHSSASVTDGRTDRQTTDKVIPMCRYASQATQKLRKVSEGPVRVHDVTTALTFDHKTHNKSFFFSQISVIEV